MRISWLDIIPGNIFKLGALPWQVNKTAPVLFIWVFVHCSGKEMSMYNDNFLMILSLAANCFEHLLSFLLAVNLFPLLLPCKVGAVLSGLRDPQHCFGDIWHFSLIKVFSTPLQSLQVREADFPVKVLTVTLHGTQVQISSVMKMLMMMIDSLYHTLSLI